MRLRRPETGKLEKVVKKLPRRVADWSPEQREQYAEQSDRAMREQAATTNEGN
ncbi:hypothetical protein [Streptomyces sp. NPDC001076]